MKKRSWFSLFVRISFIGALTGGLLLFAITRRDVFARVGVTAATIVVLLWVTLLAIASVVRKLLSRRYLDLGTAVLWNGGLVHSSRYVNFDTSTAEAIAMESSSESGKIFAAVGGRQILMCATAIQEFQYRVGRFAGPNEQERAGRLIHMITPILDSPDPQVMAVPDPNGTRMNDKIIFGTGQAWRIQTLTVLSLIY